MLGFFTVLVGPVKSGRGVAAGGGGVGDGSGTARELSELGRGLRDLADELRQGPDGFEQSIEIARACREGLTYLDEEPAVEEAQIARDRGRPRAEPAAS